MLIHKGINLRLKVNKKQEQMLLEHCGATRFIYNSALEYCKMYYEEHKKIPSYTHLAKKLSQIKRHPDYTWLYAIDSTALQGSLRNLNQAFQNFFSSRNGTRKGQRIGLPKFKSRKNARMSFRIQNYNNGTSIRIEQMSNGVRKLRLNKLGYFYVYSWRKRLALVDDCNRILSATIYRDSDHRWYVSLTVEYESQVCLPDTIRTTGVDLGISNSIVLADGRVTDSPKPLEKYANKLARLQRRWARMRKDSKNWNKMKRRIGRLYFKIKCVRKNFHHQVTSYLVKNYDVITIESLGIKRMTSKKRRNRNLARKILDEGWFQFKTFLRYKCEWYGKILLEAEKDLPSSKTCSKCGQLVKLNLLMRKWKCPTCATIHNRDHNAALNLNRISTIFVETGKEPTSRVEFLNSFAAGTAV